MTIKQAGTSPSNRTTRFLYAISKLHVPVLLDSREAG